MNRVFVISDLHLGHDNIYKFINYDGSKVRPYANAAEGDAVMVERWNSVVKPDDKVYVLGDVAFHHKHLDTIGQCHGRKVLIRGNHDTLKLSQYAKYFYDVRGSHKIGGALLTHIPIHPDCMARWVTGCIHGHLHANQVMLAIEEADSAYGLGLSTTIPDPRYLNVCVERINYTPMDFDEAIATLERNQR